MESEDDILRLWEGNSPAAAELECSDSAAEVGNDGAPFGALGATQAGAKRGGVETELRCCSVQGVVERGRARWRCSRWARASGRAHRCDRVFGLGRPF